MDLNLNKLCFDTSDDNNVSEELFKSSVTSCYDYEFELIRNSLCDSKSDDEFS